MHNTDNGTGQYTVKLYIAFAYHTKFEYVSNLITHRNQLETQLFQNFFYRFYTVLLYVCCKAKNIILFPYARRSERIAKYIFISGDALIIRLSKAPLAN